MTSGLQVDDEYVDKFVGLAKRVYRRVYDQLDDLGMSGMMRERFAVEIAIHIARMVDIDEAIDNIMLLMDGGNGARA